ncbi:MAG: GntR family transcriptional regulator, partial [Verrucomicrobiota bacterium]
MENYSSSEPFGISESSGSKPPKAYRNNDFLNSTAARHIRVQCELLEPFYRFKNQAVNNSIVFFGSARIQPIATIEQKLKTLENESGGADLSDERAFLEGQLKVSKYYEDARILSKELTQWSMDAHAPEERYYICSGGGPGIMEAANRGANEAGGRSIGLGISLPFESSNNPYIPQELNFEFHYFFIRKYWFPGMSEAQEPQAQSVGHQIAEEIREMIVDGRLGADDRLPGEQDLATRFGVSRPSVREALKR